MKKIKHFVKCIDEELEGAEKYAEKYLELKADGISDLAGKYKDMAEDELKHAMVIHEQAVDEIAKIRKVFTPPADMLEKWNTAHEEYIKRTNYVKSLVDL